jgi:NAD(P)-dependent dehydrogenase (short-subunit alcohol dehydrogenase family)
LDVLFNNAGRTAMQAFEDTSEETWHAMLNLHLTGVFLCSKYLLPLMKKTGGGSIIQHASIDSMLGNPTIAAYSAAKGGLLPLTHVMAHDLARYGIRVNSLSSGAIRTAMSRGKEEASARRVAVTPLKRMGTPEEVARVALFLASDWSSYVNGTNLVVDGGRTGITQGCF